MTRDLDQAMCDRMGGTADCHSIQSAGNGIRDHRAFGQNDRERTGHETFGKCIKQWRGVGVFFGICRICHVDDQWVVRGTAFGGVYLLGCRRIQRTARQSVHCLCRNRDKLTGRNIGTCLFHGIFPCFGMIRQAGYDFSFHLDDFSVSPRYPQWQVRRSWYRYCRRESSPYCKL